MKEFIKDLEDLISDADYSASKNMRNYQYVERGKGQLDFAFDLKRIVDKYKANL